MEDKVHARTTDLTVCLFTELREDLLKARSGVNSPFSASEKAAVHIVVTHTEPASGGAALAVATQRVKRGTTYDVGEGFVVAGLRGGGGGSVARVRHAETAFKRGDVAVIRHGVPIIERCVEPSGSAGTFSGPEEGSLRV